MTCDKILCLKLFNVVSYFFSCLALDFVFFFSFFPSRLQPIISIVSNTVFLALVKVKICKKPQRKYDISSSSNATITITLPGTDPTDAERRK